MRASISTSAAVFPSLLSFVAGAIAPFPLQAQEPLIVVRERDLDCVVEHAETYLSDSRTILMIDLRDCGKEQTTVGDVNDARQNSLPSPWKGGAERVSDFLPVTKKEIVCLVQRRADIVTPVPVEAAGTDNLVAIDFSLCGTE